MSEEATVCADTESMEGFCGYYPDLAALLSDRPHPESAGSFFVNGETLSLWVWDAKSAQWVDSNRPLQHPLSGIVDDPLTYLPENKKGVKAYYLFHAGKAEELLFTHFCNHEEPLRVNIVRASLVALYWDGDFWSVQVMPLFAVPYLSGAYTDYRYAWSDSESTPPTIDRFNINPGALWSETPLEATENRCLWFVCAKFDNEGAFSDTEIGWSLPQRLTGQKGESGADGVTLRMRGSYQGDAAYLSDSHYRDVVLYQGASFIVKKLVGEVPIGTNPTDGAYWETFLTYTNVATEVLLAEHASIDLLGSNALYIGADEMSRWEMKSGEIYHTGSGLRLTANGLLEAPIGTVRVNATAVEQIAAAATAEMQAQIALIPQRITLAITQQAVARNLFVKKSMQSGFIIPSTGGVNTAINYYYYRNSFLPVSGDVLSLSGIVGYSFYLYFYDTSEFYLGYYYTQKAETIAILPDCAYIRYAISKKPTEGSQPEVFTEDLLQGANIMLEYGSVAHSYTPAPEELLDQQSVVSAINLSPGEMRIDADKITLNGAVIASGIMNSTEGLNVNNKFRVYASGALCATDAILSGNITAQSGQIACFKIEDETLTSKLSPSTGSYVVLGAKGIELVGESSWIQAAFNGGDPNDFLSPSHAVRIKYVATSQSGSDIAALRITASGAASRSLAIEATGGLHFDFTTTDGSGNDMTEHFTLSGLRQRGETTTWKGEVKVHINEGVAYLVLDSYTQTKS